MRVLHVIDKLSMDGKNPSSCTVLFGGWAPCLRGSDCEIEVLSLANDKEVATYLESRDVPTSFANCAKHSLKNIEEIVAYVAGRHCDLVHLHGYGAAHFGRIAAARAGVPNIVHEHAVLKVKPQHYLIDRLLRNKTDAAIAVSEYVREFMIKSRSIPADRIRVIGNGIDITRFRPPPAEEILNVRRELGIPIGAKIIGTVTRFRAEKGNEYLIRAFQQIRSEFDDAVLVIIGEGPDGKALHELAESLGIGDYVHWLGFRKDVNTLMPIFDVHVIPSFTEGFPLALAEGMAVGNAMVVTEVGGMREIGEDQSNVLFVPPANEKRIADACCKLLKDTDFANAMSKRGVRSAQDMSIEASSSKIYAFYEELIGQHEKREVR